MSSAGQRLRAAREAAGLTQRELARQITAHGVQTDQTVVSKIEKGLYAGTAEWWQAASAMLDVPLAHLLSGETRGSLAIHAGKDHRKAILETHDAPAGLRALAGNAELVNVLQVAVEEWAALRALAESWPVAALVQRDGWVAILFMLRGVAAGSTTE